MEIKLSESYKNAISLLYSMIEDEVIGFQHRKDVHANVTLPELRPLKAYLLVLTSMSEPFNRMYKWKLVFENVVLTREFKPNIEISTAKQYFDLFLYDVTSAIKTTKPYVRISYDGRTPIKIHHVALLSIHEYSKDNTLTQFEMRIDPMLSWTEIQRELQVELTPCSESTLYIGVVSPKMCDLDISVLLNNDRALTKTIRTSPGFNLIDFNVQSNYPKSFRIISKSGIALNYFYTVAILSAIPKPIIEVENLKFKEYQAQKIIEMELINKGDGVADDVQLAVLRLGSVIASRRIGPLEPNKSHSVKLEFRSSYSKPYILRIIYFKAGKPYTKDIYIS